MTTEPDTPPVTLVDLLDDLVLPPEPDPISMVPQTMGWAVIALLLLIGLGALTLILRRRWHANRYRREALAALPAASHDPEHLAHLLRQTALHAYPRNRVAGLFGPDWLAFLDRTCDGVRFQSGVGAELITGPYVATARVSPDAIEAVRHWIKHHKTGAVT